MPGKNHFDAIVVGSGITGGWAAKELTEKGLKVLVLERGSELVHGRDYLGEHVPPWKLPNGGFPDRELNKSDYAIQHHSAPVDDSNRHFFNNDRLNPYVFDKDNPFYWVRGSRVGGRSLVWGRQCYRRGAQDFEDNARDGEFLPPMGMYAVEKTIKRRLTKECPDLTFTIGRPAILTRHHNGRAACHYCGPCPRGCSTGSYFSTQSSTLPAAQATGNLTVRPDSVVESLVYDAEKRRLSAVRVIDANTKEKFTFSADMVFLCASTIASTQILLNSRSEHFPNGLANSSGVLGRYLMDHHMVSAGVGIFMDDLDRYYYGYRPTGGYIPRYRNLNEQDEDADFIRGYSFQTFTLRMDYRFTFKRAGFGAAYKESLRKPGPWMFALTGFGECLPHRDNRVFLDPVKKDRYGIPLVNIDMGWRDNEHKIRRDMGRQAQRILTAAGAAVVMADPQARDPGEAIHEMGTARMGLDPKTSVLNGWNQSHDIPNLFITDGAAMTSSGNTNPSLTYMALTARACDYAAKQWKKGVFA
jgi:choline dehydrogenase-like flavoprotein